MPRDLWYRLYPNTKYLQLIRRVEGDFPEYISRIVVAPDNTLWLGACGKILHFDEQVLETYTHHKLKDRCFYDIAAAPDGAIWIGDHEIDLIRFDGEEWFTYTKDELVGQWVYDIDISSEGDVWLGTETGLIRFDGKNFTAYTPPDGQDVSVSAITVAPDNTVWLVSNKMVHHFDGEIWTDYSTTSGLNHMSIDSITISRNGQVWIETGGPKGTSASVSHLDGKTWVTDIKVQRTMEDGITSTAITPEGEVWLGTFKGLLHFDGKHWAQYMPNTAIDSVAAPENGMVWVRTKRTMSLFQTD
jgi:ligand-binding sensor domain-containing protein